MKTAEQIVKACKKHGELTRQELTTSSTVSRGKKYKVFRCKYCSREANNYQKHREKILALKRKHASELTDGYVAHIIARDIGFKIKDVPKALIDLKRIHILIKRRRLMIINYKEKVTDY